MYIILSSSMKWLVPLLLLATSVSAQDGAAPAPPVQQVLLLQSLDRGNVTLDYQTAHFRVELDRLAGKPVNVVQFVVGPSGLAGASEQAIVAFIQSTFAGRPKPDLIVSLGGPAALFARKHRQKIFPELPLLLASVDVRVLGDAPLQDNETATLVAVNYAGLIEEIQQLLPRTKHVFMVMGSGALGQFWHRQLEQDFKRLARPVTFTWSDHLSLPEILSRCASLPPDSAIFYFMFGTDGSGAAYADEQVLSELHASANAPMFGAHGAFMGLGVVGGRLTPLDNLSRQSADVAVRLLNGAPATSLRGPVLTRGEPVFDWRELQRWEIPESRLPPGSVVRFRAPTLWQAYRRAVLTGIAALLVQSLLIAGLLYQRRARRQAESESRKNLTLAADASRRQTMAALTSSIGHELGQPLSSIMYNAQALDMMVSADRASPETIKEILSDIQSQGFRATQIIDRHRKMLRTHQLEKKPIDVHTVIGETMALVAHDMSTRHVEATVYLPSSRGVVSGDQVLLQQVFVNLLMNAMDAMAGTPPDRRHITVSTDVKSDAVAISVRDSGKGLPAEVDGRLFAPFVTTKAEGLGIGLTIAQTIVQAHGGTIDARNNPDGGATFTVTLARDSTHGIQ